MSRDIVKFGNAIISVGAGEGNLKLYSGAATSSPVQSGTATFYETGMVGKKMIGLVDIAFPALATSGSALVTVKVGNLTLTSYSQSVGPYNSHVLVPFAYNNTLPASITTNVTAFGFGEINISQQVWALYEPSTATEG